MMQRAPDPSRHEAHAAYLRAEWALFASSPARRSEAWSAVGGVAVRDVLDVGCGAGQELLPFLDGGARGVGIDVAEMAVRTARSCYGDAGSRPSPVLATAVAESLPFRSASFDVVICRVVLPYTDSERALAEIARVLRPGGVVLLKVHHARFYLAKLARGLATGRIREAVHAARVLLAEALRRTPGARRVASALSRERFHSRRRLARELAAVGLRVDRHLPGHSPQAPSFTVRHVADARSGVAAGAAPPRLVPLTPTGSKLP